MLTSYSNLLNRVDLRMSKNKQKFVAELIVEKTTRYDVMM